MPASARGEPDHVVDAAALVPVEEIARPAGLVERPANVGRRGRLGQDYTAGDSAGHCIASRRAGGKVRSKHMPISARCTTMGAP